MESGVQILPTAGDLDVTDLRHQLQADNRVAVHPEWPDAYIVADHPATAARVREAIAEKRSAGYGGTALLRVSPGAITAYMDSATSEALQVLEALLTPLIVSQSPRLVNTDWDADVTDKYRENLARLFR